VAYGVGFVMDNVSIETNDGALYTVWVNGRKVSDRLLDHDRATKLGNGYLGLGWTDVTLMLENAEEVYGL
jgi:hypothetical protein